MSSTSEEAKAFRNTEPGILFMMEVNRNRPDAGIPFDEAFANIENGISAIANNTSEYEVIARSYGYTYLLHYYSTVEPQNSQLIDNQSLSKLTNFLLTETPSNIREILPALLRLEGTWSNKELSNASKKVAIAAEEALAEYDMSEVGASRSELSKPLQDVLSLQKEQIQFLQSWSANMWSFLTAIQ